MWCAVLFLPGVAPAAQQPQWIWSADQRTGSVPEGVCCFRKSFTVDEPTAGELKIAADDEYEAFLNGRRIGTGKTTEALDQYDVTSFLRTGENLIAVRVTNTQGSTAALGVRLTIKDGVRGTKTVGTDATWLTNVWPLPLWHTPLYNDSRWAEAQTLGLVGKTPPWDDVQGEPQLAGSPAPAEEPTSEAVRTNEPTPADGPAPAAVSSAKEPREVAKVAKSAASLTRTPSPSPTANPAPAPSRAPSRTPSPAPNPAPAASIAAAADAPAGNSVPRNDEQFVVEQVLDSETTGSLLAMTFNEFGHVVAAREQGGVVLIYDANHDGLVDQVRVASDQLKDCRGLLCLNGDLFATGQGPEGLALYRLTDQNRDGQFEQIRAVLKFEGAGGRYGPHGLALGADGLLYVAVGCQSKSAMPVNLASPYRDHYEGDLVTPRYPDSDAEMAEVQSPAGTILRLTPDGQQLQAVAGGLHDATDLAFDQLGELFAQDSEAATDVGTPWFRHAAVYHVLPGAEFGWRSGAAKWPEHFVDRLPPTLETGRGRVSGMVFYNHYAFPEEYRNSLFVANWTLGKISALRLKPNGGSYSATSELFVDDPSLHVTDLAVAPDGALYFVTGDEGMAGGLYRIRWTGPQPPHAKDWGSGLSAVIRQPQLDAAWSRQRIAADKAALSKDWDRSILGVATSNANPWHYRSRALDLMQLFGPTPAAASLTPLAVAETEQVRAKAVELMGLHADDETREALIGLLSDSDRIVCRRACEALARAGQAPPVDKLIDLLKSDDRFIAWSARRLLERIPADQWSEQLLASDNLRVVLQASLALLVAQPGPENARRVLDRTTVLAGGFTTDRDFIDLLRVMQVALIRGPLEAGAAASTAGLLAEEFPSSDRLINRELMTLLTYLRVSSAMDRYLEYLGSADVHEVDKLHVALCLPLLSDGWNAGQQIQLIEFLDAAQGQSGGRNRTSAVTKASRSFAQSLSDERVREILIDGDRWPHAAVALLYRLPQQLDAATLAALKQVDGRLQENRDPTTTRLKVGIVAVLARSGDAESLAYLRGLWDADPERRPAVAMGLAQWPTGENWDYLVRSLAIVEADVAQEILEKLKLVKLAPEDPEFYRQVILRGLELDRPGADAAVALLEHWTGTQQVSDGDSQAQLTAWQNWFAQTWPDHPQAEPPTLREGRVWKYEDLVRQVAVGGGESASAANGAAVFGSAGCAACHRCGEQGQGPAPDLTGLGQRLMRREVLRSLLYPSESIAVPYLNKTIVTTRGRIVSGRISPLMEAGNVAVVQPDGQRVAVPQEQVDEARTIRASEMPEGLLEPLTAQQIQDLFAFLLSGTEPQLASRPGTAAPEAATEAAATEAAPEAAPAATPAVENAPAEAVTLGPQ